MYGLENQGYWCWVRHLYCIKIRSMLLCKVHDKERLCYFQWVMYCHGVEQFHLILLCVTRVIFGAYREWLFVNYHSTKYVLAYDSFILWLIWTSAIPGVHNASVCVVYVGHSAVQLDLFFFEAFVWCSVTFPSPVALTLLCAKLAQRFRIVWWKGVQKMPKNKKKTCHGWMTTVTNWLR